MKAAPDFELSDIFYRLLDLTELMEATYDILHELDYARQDGTRIDELDRIAAMHRIACRDAAEIRNMTSIFDGPPSSRFSDARVNAEMTDVANAYRKARKAYLVREEADAETADKSPEWKAFEDAEEAFIRFPCRTLGDVRAKADLILTDDNLDDTVRNCYRMEGEKQVWTLIPFLRSLKGESA